MKRHKRKIRRFWAGLLCSAIILNNVGIVYAAPEQLTEDNTIQESSEGSEEPTEENVDYSNLEEETDTEEKADGDDTDSGDLEEDDNTEEGAGDDSEKESMSENSSNEDGEDSAKKEDDSAYSVGNIASGIIDESYGHIEWVIDSEGTLTITGTGDYKFPRTSGIGSPWYNYNEKIKRANVSVNGITNTAWMFHGCRELTEIDMSNLDTSKVLDMKGMFSDCSALQTLKVDNFDTKQTTDMRDMFNGCVSLESLNVSNFDTSNVEWMNNMFAGCSSLTNLAVSNFNTSKVVSMNGMFDECSGLTSLDVSNFDTSQVTDMGSMFYKCSGLTSLDVSNFDTSQVKGMSHMFGLCSNLTSLDVRSFNTSHVIRMRAMFGGCNGLTNIDARNFDMSQVTEMDGMFAQSNNLTLIQSPYNVNGDVELPGMEDDIWYLSDGTVVTELPKNLSRSVAIGKNYIPEEPKPEDEGKTAYQQYVIAVYNEKNNLPIAGVNVVGNNCCYTTNENGKFIVTTTAEQLSDMKFSMKYYQAKTVDLVLNNGEETKVYMTPDYGINVTLPDMSIDVPLKSDINVRGYKLPWLDMEFRADFLPKEGKNGVSSKIPVKVEYDKETDIMKITFGVEETDEEGSTNKDSYALVKDICDGIGNGKVGKEAQNYLNKKKWKLDGKMSGISIKSSIMGYLEYDMKNETILDSGALVAMKGKGSVTYRPTSTLGIVYVKASLELSAQGTLKISYADTNVTFSAEIALGQKIGIAGGIGGKTAHFEVGAEGALKEKFSVPFGQESPLQVNFAGTVYAELKIFIFTAKQKYDFANLQLWPRMTDDKASMHNESLLSLENCEMIPRDYTTRVYNSNAGNKTGLDSDNVYPEGTPEMVRLEDGTLLAVWITDFGTKSAENRTTLVYSVRNGNSWSSPQPVHETGRADFSPVLVAEGNKAYLAWTNLDHELAEDFTIEEMLASTDVYFAVYENETFGEPVLLSESGNGKLENYVNITVDKNTQTVVWVENPENDPFGSNGRNNIYARTCQNDIWQEEQCIADNLNPITSMAVSYEEGKMIVAYTMDMDGDIGTSGDVEVFLNYDKKTERITSDNRSDKEVSFLGNTLYWEADGEILQMVGNGAGNVVTTAVSSDLGYKVMDYKGQRAILTENSVGYDSILCLSVENEAGFSKTIPITDCGKKISDYAVVYMGDGEVAAITFEKDIIDTSKDGTVYGDTNLRVYEKLQAANLMVDDIYVEEEKVASGAIVPVEIAVYNGASCELTGVEITFMCGDSVLAEHVTVPCQIGAGEGGTILTECPIGELNANMILRAQVIPKNYEDADVSDNIVETEIGSCDITFRDTDITLQDDGTALLTGKLVNIGYVPAQNVQFKLLAGGYEGEEIFRSTYGTMAAGAEDTVSCVIPASCLEFTSASDGKYVYFSCNTDTPDKRYDNNSGNLVVFPKTVTGIELAEEVMSLQVKTRGNLHAAVIPLDAFEQEVYYISDNTMVAAVDENGVVTAVGIGTATVTAITADGGFAKSCVVTVTESQDNEKFYSLNRNSLSLEKGKTEQLAVMDKDGNMLTDTIYWMSSDESVATVDENGVVTAVAGGIADIWVSMGNSFYDSCVVEVTDKEIQALLVDEEVVTLTEGETRTILVSIVPENTISDKTLHFSSSNEAVATVNESGTITAIAGGNAQITVTSVNGKEALCQVHVEALPRYTVTFDTGLGDEPQVIEGIFSGETIVLPNPPTRNGYRFGGWYTQNDGAGENFSENSVVTESLVVYAYWIKDNTTEGFWVEQIPEQVYTGSQLKPVPVVMDGGTLLQQGTDYTVTYKNNVKVGIAQVTIKGKGNYTKSIVTEFEIVPKSITAEEVSFVADDLKMGKIGSVIKPKVTVKDSKKKLVAGREYEISFEEQYYAQEIVGQELVVMVTGIGNYTGTVETNFHIYKQAVSGFVIDPVENQVYTGTVVEPQVKVYASKQEQKLGNSLMEESDYTVSYSANDKAGTAKIVITGKGIYGGTKSFSFKIVSKKLDETDSGLQEQRILVELEQDGLIYTGSALKPAVKVSFGERTLIEGKDYTVSYQNNINVPASGVSDGKRPCVIVKGKGSYTGSVKKYFAIIPKTMSEENGITVAVQDVKTTKEDTVVKPKITVKDGKKNLKEGKDYQVNYGEWTLATEKAGSIPTITITGKNGGNYAFAENGDGVITKHFHIYSVPENLAQCTVNLSLGQMEQDVKAEELTAIYTGAAIKPTVVIKKGEEILTEGKDYTVAYKNNINVPKENVKESGKPQVVIKGKGRFTGSIVKTFMINPLDLSQMQELTVNVKDVKYTGKALKPAVTVVLGKRTLKSGRDYVITYRNNIQKSEKDSETAPQAVLQGKGNYTGEVIQTFRIYEKDISKVVVDKIPNQVYTGRALEPEIKIRADKKDQIGLPNDNYVVSYQKNVKVGKGEIIINGRGEYGGSKKVTFVILPKWLEWLVK